MSGLQLVGMDLSKSNLKGSDLSHANLERADLGEANLDRANLTGANLKMVNLRLSGIPAANLDMAILDGAIWTDGKICAKASYGACRDSFQPFITAMPAASPAPTAQASKQSSLSRLLGYFARNPLKSSDCYVTFSVFC